MFEHPVCTADIFVGAGVGRFLDAAKGRGLVPSRSPFVPGGFRLQVLADTLRSTVATIAARYSAGATVYDARGVYMGEAEPTLVVRLLGTDDRKWNGLPPCDRLRDGAVCIATELQSRLYQWEVWTLFRASSGKTTLLRATDASHPSRQRCSRARIH